MTTTRADDLAGQVPGVTTVIDTSHAWTTRA